MHIFKYEERTISVSSKKRHLHLTRNAVTTQSTPSLFIRSARRSDADVVYGFLCDLEGSLLDAGLFTDVFRHNLANPMIHYLVAEWAGLVVGFVSCHVQYLLHHTGKVAEIQELYVKPDYRNQRIGHQLITTLDTLAIREGFVNLEVTTNRKRHDTIRFYEQEHFSSTHLKLVKSLLT
ncbi:MAG: family acetyltransferase [Spirosoma sp.]|nr:family acetyltransferase [Spirosoma sp.]